MSNIDRVKYNESSMFGWVKERIDIVFMGLDHVQSTNDIIEIYNVVKYIENIDSVDNLSAKDKSEYKKKLSILNEIIGKYFSNVTANNFDIYIENLYHDYVSDFWSLMCKFKKIREIEEEKFKNYLDVHPNHMNAILAQKDLSQQFADVIFQHLKDHPYGIRFIISSLFERKHQVQKTMYIRKTFSAEQLNALYTAYIKMENPNIHMLKLLRISQNDLQIGLDDEIRLLAKRKEEVLIEELSKSPSAVHIENKVGISFQDADQIPEVITEDRDKIIVYDGRWIRDNPDYPTLLNKRPRKILCKSE